MSTSAKRFAKDRTDCCFSRKKGKRVASKGKYLLTKEDILEVVQDLEQGTRNKKTKKEEGRRTTKSKLFSSEEEGEESIDELT